MEIQDAKVVENIRVFRNSKRYLEFRSQNLNQITGTRIIPPELGKKGFGSVEVRLKTAERPYTKVYRRKTQKP